MSKSLEPLISRHQDRCSQLELTIPEACDLDILGCMGSQLSIRGLHGLKNAGNLASLHVVFGDGEDCLALEGRHLLLVLAGVLVGVAGCGQSNCCVVSGGTTPSLCQTSRRLRHTKG